MCLATPLFDMYSGERAYSIHNLATSVNSINKNITNMITNICLIAIGSIVFVIVTLTMEKQKFSTNDLTTTTLRYHRHLEESNNNNPFFSSSPNDYYSLYPAIVKIRDETIGMDASLIDQQCWTTDFDQNEYDQGSFLLQLPILHEGEESRVQAYESHLSDKTQKVSPYAPLPKLISMEGKAIKVRYSEYGDMGKVGFYAMSVWNDTVSLHTENDANCQICVEPPTEDPNNHHRLLPVGDYVAFVAYMWGHYGHSTHDNLPWFAYLKAMMNDPSKKFLLFRHGRAEEILSTIDAEFVQNQVIWLNLHETVMIEQGSVTTLQDMTLQNNNPRLMDFLRFWLQQKREKINDNASTIPRKKVIYYNRRNVMQTHGFRYISRSVEREILQIIQDKMAQYGRSEELVMFNGMTDEVDGHRRRPLTVQEQYEIFSEASIIIGPHGSGMSGNFLWTNPMPSSCQDRVHIIEFIGDLETKDQTSPNPNEAYINHWMWLRGWPFDYHHILYEEESIRQALVIDGNNLRDALDEIWATTITGTNTAEIPSVTNVNEFLSQVMEKSMTKLVVVIFRNTWYHQVVSSYLGRWVRMYSADHVNFVTIDPLEASEVADVCNVVSNPTYQFYKAGKRINQVTGIQQESKVQEKIQQYLTVATSQ